MRTYATRNDLTKLQLAKLERDDPAAYLEYAAKKAKAKAGAKKEKGDKNNPKCNTGNYQCRGKKGVACIPKSKGCNYDLSNVPPERKAYIEAAVEGLKAEGAKPKTARIGRKLGAPIVELTPEQYGKALEMNISQLKLVRGDATREQLRAIGVDVDGVEVKPVKSKVDSISEKQAIEEIDKLLRPLSGDDRAQVDDIRQSLYSGWDSGQITTQDIEDLANNQGAPLGSIAAKQIATTEEYRAAIASVKEYERKSKEESGKKEDRDAQLEASQRPPLMSIAWPELRDGIKKDFLSMPQKAQEQVIKKYSSALDRLAAGMEGKQEQVLSLGAGGWRHGYLNELKEVPGVTFGDFAITRKSPNSQEIQVQTRDGKTLFVAKDEIEAMRTVAALSLAKPIFSAREGEVRQTDDGRFLVANEREMTSQSYQRIRRLTDAVFDPKAGIDLEAYKLVTGEDYTSP